MPDPPIIKTSLAERIAKLNAANAPSSASTSSSTASSAPGQIRSKISKYEAGGLGEAPLVPKGSFGLGAPMQKGERGMDRMRIASMGVSGGTSPRGLSPGRTSPGSGTSQRSVSSGAAFGGPSRRSPGSSRQGSESTAADRLSAVPKGLLDPELESVNSLNVETGSTGFATPVMGTPRGEKSNPLATVEITPPTEVGLAGTSTPPEAHLDHEAQVEQTRKDLEKFEAEETDPVAKPDPAEGTTTIEGGDGKPMEPPPMPSSPLSPGRSPLRRSFMHSPSASPIVPARAVQEQDLGAMNLDSVDEGSDPQPNRQSVGQSPQLSDYLTSREDTDDGGSQHSGSQFAYSDILDAYPATDEGEATTPLTAVTQGNGAMGDEKLSGHDSPALDEPELDEMGMPKVKCSDCSALVSLMALGEHVCDPATVVTSPTTNPNSPITPKADDRPMLTDRPPMPRTRSPPLDVPTDENLAPVSLEELTLASSYSSSPQAQSFERNWNPDVPQTPDIPSESDMDSSPRLDAVKQVRDAVADQSPRGLRGYQPDPKRMSWMDDEDEEQEGPTGYATIVRTSR